MAIDDSWSPKISTQPKEPAPPKTISPDSFPHFTEPPRQPAPPGQSPYDRFLASMVIAYEKWHDGIGYDLAALQQLTPDQLTSITQTLIQHSPRDWRDIEALGHINSPAAHAAVLAALQDPDPAIRQQAQDFLPQHIDPAQREKLLIHALQTTNLYGGLSQAIDEAAEFHPPAVVDALFRGTLARDGEAAVHFAALLYYIHGKSHAPFDWSHRPFFLRFAESTPALRQQAFIDLCHNLAVDPAPYW